MFDFLLKQVMSLAISVVTLYVPKGEWQQKLDSMPPQAQRIAEKKLEGAWKAGVVSSPRTGLTHTYFTHPCTDTSSKKILLLLHGFNTDGSVFFNLTPLADNMTLIAYNFPEETKLYTGSLRDFEIILDDFCETMGLDSIDLLGNSLGGIIATFYAAHTRKVDVKHLVLASTYVPGATPDNIPRLRKMADKLLPYPDYKLFYLLNLGGRIVDVRPGTPTERDAPVESIVIKKIGWYRQILSMLYWYDGTGDAGNVACPTLILHGDRDRFIPPKEVAASKTRLRNAQTSTSATAGHSLIFAEAPWCSNTISKFTCAKN